MLFPIVKAFLLKQPKAAKNKGFGLFLYIFP